jgi:hypothetical protein
MAFAFENDTNDTGTVVSADVVSDALVLANAHYYNDRSSNIRHESISGGHNQPTNGWHVCTLPGNLACECNFFYKKKFCCHLLFALYLEGKDYLGHPLPPETFAEPSASKCSSPAFPK